MSKWGKSATACRGVEPSELLEPRCSLPKKRLKVGILKAQFQNFTPRHGTCRTFSCQISRLLRHVAAGRGSSCRLPSPCFPRRQAHRPSCGAGPVPERFVPCLRAPGSAKRHPPWRALPAWPTGREGLCVMGGSPAARFLAGKSGRRLRQAPSRRRRGLRRLWRPRSSGACPGLRCGLPGDRPGRRRQRQLERHGRQA